MFSSEILLGCGDQPDFDIMNRAQRIYLKCILNADFVILLLFVLVSLCHDITHVPEVWSAHKYVLYAIT